MISSDISIPSSLKKTRLNATHRALKAKMVDFGGWDMRWSIRAQVAD